MNAIGLVVAQRSIERLQPRVVHVVGPLLDLGDLLGRCPLSRPALLADVGQQRHRLGDELGALDDRVGHARMSGSKLVHARRA